TRRLGRRLGLPHSFVWRVLRRHGLNPYHLNPVQELKPEDHLPRRTYCRWLLRMTRDQPDFLNHILWTDESGFTRDGIMNRHNLHIYSDENPRVIHSTSFQRRFRINIWQAFWVFSGGEADIAISDNKSLVQATDYQALLGKNCVWSSGSKEITGICPQNIQIEASKCGKITKEYMKRILHSVLSDHVGTKVCYFVITGQDTKTTFLSNNVFLKTLH
ncbi:hypothetical protein C0J52_06608, partial [Blattella germanica]